jgi:DNA-binding Lrp family transcriptional regulator
MVSAIVLMNIARGSVNQVAGQLVELAGVQEVFSVAGRYDLVTVIRVEHNEAMANLVTDHIQNIPNILNTETLLAFKTFSPKDMEAMFSIGFEGEG